MPVWAGYLSVRLIGLTKIGIPGNYGDVDLLAELLAISGVRGTMVTRIEAPETWGLTWAEISGAAFYAMTAGSAWLGLAGRPPLHLSPGDVVLLPTGASHTLTSARDGVAVPLCDNDAGERAWEEGRVLNLGDGETQTRMLCAAYHYDPEVHTQVFRWLPEVVHVRNANDGTCLEDTVRLLGRELSHRQFATDVVLNRLVDILLIQVLRVWLDSRPPQPEGSLLGVLADPLVTEAMLKLHEDPSRDWTASSLAAEVSVSRTTLLRRFASATGQTPGAHLTRWRMDLAALRLRDSDASIEGVAHSVGYTSVYAFTRAFSRSHALPPGKFRTKARSEK
jgi:AraC-like DNA-binding protein